jgi:hypothetical protein
VKRKKSVQNTNGKGDKRRPTNEGVYRSNYERAFRGNSKDKINQVTPVVEAPEEIQAGVLEEGEAE